MEKTKAITSNAMYDNIQDLYQKIDQKKAICEEQRDQIERIAEFLTEERQNNQINPHLAILVCIDLIYFYFYFLLRNNIFLFIFPQENQFETVQTISRQIEAEISEYMMFLKMVFREMKRTSIEYVQFKYGDKIVEILSQFDG